MTQTLIEKLSTRVSLQPSDPMLRPARELIALLTARIEQLEGEKNGAYHERDMVVAALSKCFPSHLSRHSDEDKDWEDDWRWIVYIELPTGQASWHIHNSERETFNHLDVKPNNWDGHNTERKYQRLAALETLAAPDERLRRAEAVVAAVRELKRISDQGYGTHQHTVWTGTDEGSLMQQALSAFDASEKP